MDLLDLWNNEKRQRIIYLMLCAVAVVLLILFAWRTYRIVHTYRFEPLPEHEQDAAPLNKTIKNETIARLFGNYTRTASSAVKKSTLHWKLLGVFLSSSPHQANAVIEGEDGQQRQYRIGDEVERGIQVSDIQSDRIILKRDGEFESLLLDPDALKDDEPKQPLFDFIEQKR